MEWGEKSKSSSEFDDVFKVEYMTLSTRVVTRLKGTQVQISFLTAMMERIDSVEAKVVKAP